MNCIVCESARGIEHDVMQECPILETDGPYLVIAHDTFMSDWEHGPTAGKVNIVVVPCEYREMRRIKAHLESREEMEHVQYRWNSKYGGRGAHFPGHTPRNWTWPLNYLGGYRSVNAHISVVPGLRDAALREGKAGT
jgi:hypothetical protein